MGYKSNKLILYKVQDIVGEKLESVHSFLHNNLSLMIRFIINEKGNEQKS